jgi:hypothetical protein
MDRELPLDDELDNEELEDDENEEEADDGEGDEEGTEEGGEGEGEEENEEDEITVPEEKVVSSRENNRLRTLSARAKEAEAQALKYKQEAEQYRAQQLAQQANGNDQIRRQEFLSSLSEEDRRIYLLQEQIQTTQAQIQYNSFQMQDRADKAEYEAKAAGDSSTSSLYKRFGPKVEAMLVEMRTKHNLNAPREKVLAAVIGEYILNQKSKPVSKKEAANRMKKQKAKPTTSRSDVSSSDRRKGNDREERMKRLEQYKF